MNNKEITKGTFFRKNMSDRKCYICVIQYYIKETGQITSLTEEKIVTNLSAVFLQNGRFFIYKFFAHFQRGKVIR